MSQSAWLYKMDGQKGTMGGFQMKLNKVNKNYIATPEENIVDENGATTIPVIVILAAISAAGVILAGITCRCSCNCFTSSAVAYANQGTTTGVVARVK